MKIKTPFFIIEIEWLFLIIFFLFCFSEKMKKILFNFFICYLFIVFHEISHMLVSTILGKDVEMFKVTLSGVCIELKKEKYILYKKSNSSIENLKNILIYIAGPISNFILARIFYKYEMIYQINLFLTFINLLPLYPLDGYNILTNILHLFKINIVLEEIIFKILSYTLYFCLIFLGIVQLLISENISIIIFLLYIFLLKKNNIKKTKLHRKFIKNRY